jgi:hypothetical protein
MKAGLALYRVGEFVAGDDARPPYRVGKSYIKLCLPPDGNDRLTRMFNNRLVNLCQLTYAGFVEAAAKKAVKQKKKAGAGASGSQPPPSPADPPAAAQRLARGRLGE